MNKIKLLLSAIIKFSFGIIFVGLLLFLPAGTIKFFNAWLFIGLLFIPMFILGIFLFIKSPELLEKRLNVKEKENEQKQVIAVSGIMFILGFIIAGLNYRYNWIMIPNIVVIIASIIFIGSPSLKSPNNALNVSSNALKYLSIFDLFSKNSDLVA